NSVTVKALPPMTLVFLRVIIAAALLWCVILARGGAIPKQLSVWRTFLIMAVLNNVVPFCLIVWGQKEIGAGLAAILNATTPLFGVVVAGLFLADERATFLKSIGALIGFGGVVVMIGPQALGGLSVGVVSQLAILGAALSYAFAGAYGRRFARMGLDPLLTSAGQVTAASVVLLPLALAFESPFAVAPPAPHVWASVFLLAAACTAFAYILYFHLLATAGATNILLVTFLVPVSAIALSAIFLGERLTPLNALGMALIGLGLTAIDGRLWRRLSRPKPA
ncbi:MAG: DMT family transporter, partial [Pseudomonadota bacterium]